MNFKSIFKKANIMPVAVLGIICLAVAILVAGINLITRDVIKAEEDRKISESLSIVMEGGEFEKLSLPEDSPSTVTALYKEKSGKGHVVILTKQGYKAPISISVGIDTDGKITGAVITSQAESHGKTGIDDYVSGFIGKDSAGSESHFSANHVTGATVTSEKIKEAIYDAFVVLGYAAAKDSAEAPEFTPAGEASLTESDAVEIAKELMDGSYTKVDLPENMPETTHALYKRAEGGYAIHLATQRIKWSPTENEAIVTVDGFGYITGVKMIQWNVGYDKELLDSAPVCTEEYLDSFIGKNASSLNRVEIVTNATLTNNFFGEALRGALEVLYPVPIYSIIAIAIIALAVAVPVALVIIVKVRRKKNEAK